MDSAAPEVTLSALGRRIRALRQEKGLTLRALAERSGVSERFLSDVEGGKGNISVAKLAALAQALGTSLSGLFLEAQASNGARLKELSPALSRLSAEELAEVEKWVHQRFARQSDRHFVALLGLRGAGKSTVGAQVAKRLGWSFVELDALIEAEAGLTLAELFEIHGEAYYRRLEFDTLEKILNRGGRAVIATGGGIVQNPEAFALLGERCVTVWLKATPDQHWTRVIHQGDVRPMKGRAHARTELQALLKSREPLYSRAHYVVDTSARDVTQVVDEVAGVARGSV